MDVVVACATFGAEGVDEQAAAASSAATPTVVTKEMRIGRGYRETCSARRRIHPPNRGLCVGPSYIRGDAQTSWVETGHR